jgi:DNA-binding HxlR family transcriptional regulator
MDTQPVDAPPAERIRPEDLKGRPCSIAGALAVVGDRWSLLAVREVMFGNHRFSEIARNTGAPRDRIAARLKVLVEAGVLEKRRYQEAPPRSSYHLTEAGKALSPVLLALREWGDQYVMTERPMVLEHHGHEVTGAWYCTTCGQPVLGRDLHRHSTVPGWDLTGPVEAEHG